MTDEKTEVYGESEPEPYENEADRIENLLKRAEYASTEEEAYEAYDRILDIDVDYDLAWYKKWKLRRNLMEEFYKADSSVLKKVKEKSSTFSESLEYVASNRKEIASDLKKEVSDLKRKLEKTADDTIASIERASSIRNEEADGGLNKAGKFLAEFASDVESSYKESKADNLYDKVKKKESTLDDRTEFVRKLGEAVHFFQNAVKAKPDNYEVCPECEGSGVIINKEEVERFLLPDTTRTNREFCGHCFGMGRIRRDE